MTLDEHGTNTMTTTDLSDNHHDLQEAPSAVTNGGLSANGADPIGSRVVTVAVINDYEVVVRGVAQLPPWVSVHHEGMFWYIGM